MPWISIVALDEDDREDLLREASALIERIEIEAVGLAAPLLAGFRRDGSFSIYFAGDPVYQFNTQGQLRRAYVAGLLYKAHKGNLVSLRRERSAKQTMLLGQEIDARECGQFRLAMCGMLDRLSAVLDSGSYEIRGQVPPEAAVIRRIRDWLARYGDNPPIANSPRAG